MGRSFSMGASVLLLVLVALTYLVWGVAATGGSGGGAALPLPAGGVGIATVVVASAAAVAKKSAGRKKKRHNPTKPKADLTKVPCPTCHCLKGEIKTRGDLPEWTKKKLEEKDNKIKEQARRISDLELENKSLSSTIHELKQSIATDRDAETKKNTSKVADAGADAADDDAKFVQRTQPRSATTDKVQSRIAKGWFWELKKLPADTRARVFAGVLSKMLYHHKELRPTIPTLVNEGGLREVYYAEAMDYLNTTWDATFWLTVKMLLDIGYGKIQKLKNLIRGRWSDEEQKILPYTIGDTKVKVPTGASIYKVKEKMASVKNGKGFTVDPNKKAARVSMKIALTDQIATELELLTRANDAKMSNEHPH